MAERDAFEEWWMVRRRQGEPYRPVVQDAFEAGARSRDGEVERSSYDRGYETGCAAASYTNEESDLAHLHVLREALRDLSHQLNRHRCGNWEPELKAADERARAALGEYPDA